MDTRTAAGNGFQKQEPVEEKPDAAQKQIQQQPKEIHYVNPFVHKLIWDDPIDKVKTALLTVFLLPFRVILIIICLVIAWSLANIGLYGLSREELRTKPLSGWRRQLRHLTALVMRMLFVFGSFHFIRTKGERASPKDAPVICVAPHTAFYDSLCVVLFGPSAVVAKIETASLPFFGKLIDYAQPIYVCREDPNSRQSTIKEIIERANSKEDWPQILIFPEGTCTNRTSLIQFKPGAFYPGVPIQPVLVRYPNKVDTVTWTWEGPDALQLLWRTLTQFHTFCEIEFLPVYYPNEEEKRDPKLYARNVRNLMAHELGIPISDYTFDDCKLMTFVKNVNMPYAAFIADIEKLRKALGLHKRNVEEQLVATEAKFTEETSYLTMEEFARRLDISVDEESTKKLFRIFVKPDRMNVIDIREYLLLSLFLITLYSPKLNYAKSLFQLYGNRGKVSRESFYSTLKHLVKINAQETDAMFMTIDSQNLGEITFDQFTAALDKYPALQRKLQKNNDPNNLRLT
ncbi:lysophosphatidylcholine acyltransferase isoform X1 [Toxorhynchites rutilus septentrionalis]|uniref:lysophosphatidylcholine acyltransferase isoform X1 n=1 Tax=Toxorhynchites rutilus septentrionalis TaxID=329112 RepID=UPI00247AE74A|nr:lysophosphatidylcholine acyltransferase isoform X1 [Toxorhynchites rutilus septentrionalis]XP_055616568.1 lysophosphatidylcholine acyltransferase isoform X1 [Toxorhynchites rutilus septentrionalis]